jgi:peptidoglycan-N-acetylglucosamine deacetylase
MRTHSKALGFVALAALTTFVHCSSNRATEKPGCVGAQALSAAGLRGTSMPAKTLALTFDDGPGLRTKALSTFLKEQGIQAAFFVNGMAMGGLGVDDVLQQLVDDGHIVANHTETHVSLTGLATATPRPADADVLRELVDTDVKIEPFVPHKRFLSLPPFGDWDEQTHTTLASTDMNKYVGPILWDTGDRMDEAAGYAADWDCWQDGSDGKRLSVQACGDLYLTQIRRIGKGIVLLHDPYFNEDDPEQGGTVEMTMYMVPILKAEGFEFMRVEMVPEIDAQLPPLEPTAVDPEPTEPGGGEEPPAGEPPPPPENPCP